MIFRCGRGALRGVSADDCHAGTVERGPCNGHELHEVVLLQVRGSVGYLCHGKGVIGRPAFGEDVAQGMLG